jgi:hypothetical protein
LIETTKVSFIAAGQQEAADQGEEAGGREESDRSNP